LHIRDGCLRSPASRLISCSSSSRSARPLSRSSLVWSNSGQHIGGRVNRHELASSLCHGRLFSSSSRILESLYDVLEIPRTASKHQIKASFYKLSKKYHPDLNLIGKQDAETRFVAVSNAWSVLGDERKRRAYDRELDQSTKAPSFRPPSGSTGGTTTSFHSEDLQRRSRATYAWSHHPRPSNFARYDHLGRRSTGPNGFDSSTSSRTSSGGGRRKAGTTKKDPLDEYDLRSQRIQADSGVWRFVQVFGVFWVVTILTGGFSVNAT